MLKNTQKFKEQTAQKNDKFTARLKSYSRNVMKIHSNTRKYISLRYLFKAHSTASVNFRQNELMRFIHLAVVQFVGTR